MICISFNFCMALYSIMHFNFVIINYILTCGIFLHRPVNIAISLCFYIILVLCYSSMTAQRKMNIYILQRNTERAKRLVLLFMCFGLECNALGIIIL